MTVRRLDERLILEVGFVSASGGEGWPDEAKDGKLWRTIMAYRYEELTNAPSGDGLPKNQWHTLRVTPTALGQVLDLAGFITWSVLPRSGIQVAGYAALTWTDGGRWGGTQFIGATRPILTPHDGGTQGFHRFDDEEVDRYRDSQGYLPDGCGIIYYIASHLPDMKWRFFGAVP